MRSIELDWIKTWAADRGIPVRNYNPLRLGYSAWEKVESWL